MQTDRARFGKDDVYRYLKACTRNRNSARIPAPVLPRALEAMLTSTRPGLPAWRATSRYLIRHSYPLASKFAPWSTCTLPADLTACYLQRSLFLREVQGLCSHLVIATYMYLPTSTCTRNSTSTNVHTRHATVLQALTPRRYFQAVCR